MALRGENRSTGRKPCHRDFPLTGIPHKLVLVHLSLADSRTLISILWKADVYYLINITAGGYYSEPDQSTSTYINCFC